MKKVINLVIILTLISCSYKKRIANPIEFTDFNIEPPDTKSKKVNLNQPLDLKLILKIAFQQNPDVDILKSRIVASRSKINQILFDYYPEISISGGIRHTWNKERFLPPSRNSDPKFAYNYLYTDIAVKVPIYTGGKTKNESSALNFKYKSLNTALKRLKQGLKFEIVKIWYLILRSKFYLKELNISKENLLKIMKYTELRIKQKKAAPLLLYNLKVKVGQLKFEQIKERGIIDSLFSEMGKLSGIDVKRIKKMKFTESWSIPPKLKMQVSSQYKFAMNNRFDVKEIKYKILSEEKLIATKKSIMYPSVYGVLNWGYRVNTELQNGESGFIGLEVSFPLINYFKTNSIVNEEKANLNILKKTLFKLQLKIKSEIEITNIAIKTALAQITTAKKTLDLAKINYKISEKKLMLSMSSSEEILMAHDEILKARINYFKALTDLYIARARLELVLGKK